MEILENVSLKNKNWFETGGSARFYAEPDSAEDFKQLIEFKKEKNLETFILGDGANILVSDEGFDGLIIKPMVDEMLADGNLVKAGAGVVFQDLIDFCLDNNLLGLEEFSGIPGTIGGSVYINIHYFEFLLSEFLVSGTVVDVQSGEILEVDNNWFEFGYDKSKLTEKNHILIEASFKLEETDDFGAAFAKGRSHEIIRHRARRYPAKCTCGSFFRNFREDDPEFDNLPVINDRKMVYAAYYLDKVGVKGSLKVGDAIVSSKHANMIENLGSATSTDIVNLVNEMQVRVKDEFCLVLKPECQLVGFKEFPFMK